ncbi:MAG: bifunctional nuclease family protein [Deltaproteobacteria bacterium]|nr:bifunctional nuclease family protein [Deltaproteobacteria bacterium]
MRSLLLSLALVTLPVGCAHTSSAPAATEPATAASAEADEGAIPTPEGFFRVDILGVIPGPEGHALFLVEPLTRRLLPIWIGQTEAMSIQLRLDRRRFERPLTHDLIDQLLELFDARVREVRVDAVHDGTFVATLTLLSDRGSTRLDVRPSDAIALAVSSRAPIFVARQVMDKASLSAEALERGRPPLLSPEPPAGAPEGEEEAPGASETPAGI